ELDEALDLAAERASAMDSEEIMIGGGGEIYAQTIARARRLFITEVALDAEGEARFPPIDPHEWREVSRDKGERGPRDDADFALVSYERRGGTASRLKHLREAPNDQGDNARNKYAEGYKFTD